MKRGRPEEYDGEQLVGQKRRKIEQIDTNFLEMVDFESSLHDDYDEQTPTTFFAIFKNYEIISDMHIVFKLLNKIFGTIQCHFLPKIRQETGEGVLNIAISAPAMSLDMRWYLSSQCFKYFDIFNKDDGYIFGMVTNLKPWMQEFKSFQSLSKTGGDMKQVNIALKFSNDQDHVEFRTLSKSDLGVPMLDDNSQLNIISNKILDQNYKLEEAGYLIRIDLNQYILKSVIDSAVNKEMKQISLEFNQFQHEDKMYDRIIFSGESDKTGSQTDSKITITNMYMKEHEIDEDGNVIIAENSHAAEGEENDTWGELERLPDHLIGQKMFFKFEVLKDILKSSGIGTNRLKSIFILETIVPGNHQKVLILQLLFNLPHTLQIMMGSIVQFDDDE